MFLLLLVVVVVVVVLSVLAFDASMNICYSCLILMLVFECFAILSEDLLIFSLIFPRIL